MPETKKRLNCEVAFLKSPQHKHVKYLIFMILVIGMKASLFAKWQTFENRLQYKYMYGTM